MLRRPPRAERELLDVAVAEAADAVEVIADRGRSSAAMNRFNGALRPSRAPAVAPGALVACRRGAAPRSPRDGGRVAEVSERLGRGRSAADGGS